MKISVSRPLNRPARTVLQKQEESASLDSVESDDLWYQKQKARDVRLQNYVRRAGGRFENDGSGDYKIGSIPFRTFPGRAGYQRDFLGAEVDLPKVDDSVADQIAPRVDDPTTAELEYTHFSILQNKMRRMPMFTAVNIDGSQSKIERDKVRWAYEGRLAPQHQLGNAAYKNNDIDRGHIVHGQSPAWGAAGASGRADTYVYTNVGLQHKGLNQEEWLDLENQLLNKAETSGKKLSVFAGPVFQDDDKFFDNKGKISPAVQMPTSFWKVVVWNDSEKGIQSESFVMSQTEDLARPEGERTPYYEKGADLSQYRVPLQELEELAKLSFDDLKGTDAQNSFLS